VSCPNRHGLTAGEIARWRMAEERLDLDLTVIELGGWHRGMGFAATGLPWVMPSPNMPTVDTALVYPGMCAVEGSELSEGRGTTRPFELAGAPYLDPYRLAAALAAERLPGVTFRPVVFRPTFHKHAGLPCGGVQQHVTDPHAYRPYLTGLAFLKAAWQVADGAAAWRAKAYEFVDAVPAIDLLTGDARARALIEAGAPLAELVATWADAEQAFLRGAPAAPLVSGRAVITGRAVRRQLQPAARGPRAGRAVRARDHRASTSCGWCRPGATRSARSWRSYDDRVAMCERVAAALGRGPGCAGVEESWRARPGFTSSSRTCHDCSRSTWRAPPTRRRRRGW
jgi:hypothetical protein